MTDQIGLERTKLELTKKMDDQQTKLNDEDFASFHDSCKRRIEKVSTLLGCIEQLENGTRLSDEDVETIDSLMDDNEFYYDAEQVLISAEVID